MQENTVATIREMKESDTDNIVKWRNAPSVMDNFIYRTPLTRETHLAWIKNHVQTGKVVQFVIEDTAAKKDVGSVYLRDIDRKNRRCEFGIFIGEESCRGKGIGTAATKQILAYAFEVLQMNRVFLRVFAKNPRAIRAYEKAGFQTEGIFREDVIIDGVPYDMVYMAILKKDYLREV